MGVMPMIVEKEGNIERTYDPYSRLLKERIIMVEGAINTQMANIIVAQLLLLEMQDPDADITMYINSPGGEVMAGLAIADTMEFISCDVVTLGIGMQASMGSFLLASGTQGKRYALKRSSIMIHRLSSGTNGDYHSIEANFEHIKKLHEDLTKDYVRLSGGKTSYEKFQELMRYDNWLSLEDAIKYGIIDHIISDRKSFKKALDGDKDE
jgi:ATP-dependent Clp protease protease subunit